MSEPTLPATSSQPSDSTVLLVQNIMDNKPSLGELLRLTAVPFWFDRELLAALRANRDGMDDNFWALLQELSFVQIGHGRCWYSPEMRGLLQQQWAGNTRGLATAHRRALGYFERRLAESPPDNPAAYEELLQARLYHLLAVDEKAGIQLLLDLFSRAQEEYRLAAATQFVNVAETQRAILSADGQATLDYMQGRVQQLSGHWDASRTHLKQMLEQGGLSSALEMLVTSALARSLVELQREQDGIKLYKQALAACRQQGDRSQAMRIMVGLGYAYLSMAARVWGGGWLRSPAPRARFQVVHYTARVLARLPLIIYLMSKLGFRSSFTAVHRIGTGIDWMVARLLGLAAQWFRRVEATSRSEDTADREGLVRAWEGMAQLYRLLDCPHQAKAMNGQILRMEGVQSEGYRAARARLGLAHAMLLRGEAVQAQPVLEQILPVFTGFGHRQRIAETQTLLARAELVSSGADAAVQRYDQALGSWQQVGDQATETDVVLEMETLRGHRDLSPEARETIDKASQQVADRTYRTRYSHPLLTRFQQVALIGLVILFFFTIRLALRTEYGTTVDPTVDLVKPVYQLVSRQGSFPDLVLSDVAVTIDRQLRPQPPLDLVGTVILGAFAGYLAVYTILGLFFIVGTPLQIKPGQVQGIVTSRDGIKAITSAGEGKLLNWDQITLFLRSDRVVVQKPLALLSFFALFNQDNPLDINAFTRHYEALQSQIRRRLKPQVQVRDLGFSLLHSRSGRLFLASLAYLILFFILAWLAPDVVLGTVGQIPYNLTDLFGLAYLGVALPLAWWFAVQPLRAHWLVWPKTVVVWLVGGVGLALAALSALQIHWWHLPLGRPDIAIGLMAMLLVASAGQHILRARRQGGAQPQEYAWSSRVRVAAAVVAGLVIAATLASMGWELLSFHYLAVGNTRLRKAEALEQLGEHQEALPDYERALEAYERSISLRPEPYMSNSRGVIDAQLGNFTDAVLAYRKAQMGDPDEPTYVINLALLYEDQAADQANGAKRITYYDITIGKLNEAIALMERRPKRYASQLITAHLLRAGAYYDRAQLYHDIPDQEQTLEDFHSTLADYNWLAGAAPDRPSVYTGRGWTMFRLREEVKGSFSRPYLEAAIADFNRAIEKNPDDMSAFTGLGWAYRFLAATYPACRDRKGDPAEAAELDVTWRHLEAAIRAYDEVIAREPEDPNHYRVRGQLHWLVAGCDPSLAKQANSAKQANMAKQPELEKSLGDYSQAIALDPHRAELYYTRGHLYYALWFILPQAARNTAVDDKAFALDDFKTANALEPHNSDYRNKLDGVANEWRDYGVAAEAWQKAAVINPTDANAFYRLGWRTYQLGEYARSVKASAKAIELDPKNAAAIFNQGLAYLAIGDLQSALQSYRLGVQAANAQTSAEKRKSWYSGAIGDLKSIQTDPMHAADMFVRFVEAGRDLRLLGQTCSVFYGGPDGLSVRSGLGPVYVPRIAVMTRGAEFIVLTRSADGQWLHGLVKEPGIPGWVRNLREFISCPAGVSDAPVETLP